MNEGTKKWLKATIITFFGLGGIFTLLCHGNGDIYYPYVSWTQALQTGFLLSFLFSLIFSMIYGFIYDENEEAEAKVEA